MDIISEWPSKEGSCKLYMRGPNPEPDLTNIQMKPEIHLDHVGANEFSPQMIKSNK